MYTYFDKFFVKHQRGFRKGYNAQHCFLVMIEKIKEARDKNKVCTLVLTDLSKAFECLNPFQANVLFLYLLKTSENLWFSDVFRAYRKRTLA